MGNLGLEQRLLSRYGGVTMTSLDPPMLHGAWLNVATGQRFDVSSQ
jgi:hypothetical protein